MPARVEPAPGMFLTTMVGLPGMWRAEMARDRAGIDVVAAAGIAADDELDGLAGVVVLRRGGRRGEPAARIAHGSKATTGIWHASERHLAAPTQCDAPQG